MPKTLLLADDSVTIQKVVAISFAGEDVEVIAVDNGDDAIAKTREALPDVVLADVVMPGKNGYEVCEAIRADPALAHIPVLLLTGTFEAFDEARAQRAGATGHIAKPFEAQALVEEVRRLFSVGTATPVASVAEPVVTGEPIESAVPADIDAFDFFDDEPSETGVSASDGAVDDAALDLEFRNPGSSFEFSQEDPAPPDTAPRDVSEEPATDPAASSGSSIPVTPVTGDFDTAPEPVEVTDAGARAGTTTLDTELEELSIEPGAIPLESEDIAGESLVASTSAEESFDFAVDSTPSEGSDSANSPDDSNPVLPIDADDLAQGTIIDPKGASGYDVSSSDLGPVSTLEPLPDRPTDTADAISGYAEPTSGLIEPDATILAPLFQTAETPAGDLGESGGIDPEPVAIAVEEGPPINLVPESQAAPATAEGSSQPAAPASAETVLQNIEPELRRQLHDTLEKIAWESFGDLTDVIVRQSVERVEAIAWEVIPQMAETLIREEIRRLQGEPPEDG